MVFIRTFIITVLLVPAVVSAQLSSTNYQIDAYVVGENGAGFASSTNFITTSGVENFEFVESAVSPGSGGSATRVDQSDEEDDVSSTTDDVSTTVDVPTEIPIETVTPYVPSVVTDDFASVPVSPDDVVQTNTLVFTPSYAYADRYTAVSDDATTDFYLVLENGEQVYVNLPNNAFFIPANYQGSQGTYKVYVTIQSVNLPTSQYPTDSYQAQLAHPAAYTITAVDSRGRIVEKFAAPLAITIDFDRRISVVEQVKGYVFDTTNRAWAYVPNVDISQKSVGLRIDRPSLFALWTGSDLLRVLSIDEGVQVADDCPKNNCDTTMTWFDHILPYVWWTPWILLALLLFRAGRAMWDYLRDM